MLIDYELSNQTLDFMNFQSYKSIDFILQIYW